MDGWLDQFDLVVKDSIDLKRKKKVLRPRLIQFDWKGIETQRIIIDRQSVYNAMIVLFTGVIEKLGALRNSIVESLREEASQN